MLCGSGWESSPNRGYLVERYGSRMPSSVVVGRRTGKCPRQKVGCELNTRETSIEESAYAADMAAYNATETDGNKRCRGSWQQTAVLLIIGGLLVVTSDLLRT